MKRFRRFTAILLSLLLFFGVTFLTGAVSSDAAFDSLQSVVQIG